MLLAGLCFPVLAASAESEPFGLNMHSGVTSGANSVYQLHMLVFWVCAVIGAGVFLVMLWSLVRHRRARGAEAAQFSGNTTLEIVWTIIPVLILAMIAVPATSVLLAINALPTPGLTVDIRGSQWKWHYAYAGQNIAYYSNLGTASRDASRKGATASPASVSYYLREVDNPLVLPVGEHVRLRLTSDDVIHSWWVPALGFKRDAIPGYINEADIVIDKPGIYRGQCTELCGTGHGFMPIVVQAVTKEEFQQWVTQSQQAAAAESSRSTAPWSREAAMEEGRKTFESSCAACHQADGKGIPGAFPALDGSAVVNGPLQAHLTFVIHGSPRNPIMRPFGKELSDRQLAGVLTYERNAWGNHTGDLVTPEQAKAAR